MTRQTITAGIVRTTAGPVQGSLEDGLLVFKGIPYAAPPVGDLRWKPAVPHPGWTGVFAAESFGASAPQPFDPTGSYDRVLGNHGTPPFDEDCLTLNVWTPATDSERRPVLVWIHGGGFVSGSGSLPVYHGDTFARNGDTVVVSINYRIGVFGFFLAESGDNGNLWLSDQSIALKWVHENIALFGGDPDNITVAGESGGAFSAATLAIQADTSPLIKRVILQSPPLGLKLDSIDDARRGTAQLVKAAGLDDDDVSSLRNMPWESVLGLSFQRFAVATRFGHWTTPFLPIIDGVSLLEHPLDTLINGGASDIDVLIGWNVDEASFSFALNPELQDVSKERVEERLAERFDATLLPTAYEAYAGEERIAKNPLASWWTSSVMSCSVNRLSSWRTPERRPIQPGLTSSHSNHQRTAVVWVRRIVWSCRLPSIILRRGSMHPSWRGSTSTNSMRSAAQCTPPGSPSSALETPTVRVKVARQEPSFRCGSRTARIGPARSMAPRLNP
ncbi:carboxylesterase family protein [Pseudarthrobacter psychrotolerans]|uniref:Carboxylic ester hydrolase n=1 Tax=Pseudarthrobacter psychrotolerans TaxID=2697569 RepID=A0A6P1NGM2_9MICC|nr:carboxylesterase family protein [Pseudarthrobacter psychrotolerans]QHK18498.1 carboxylesterase family protein [Pseudarthrobacter psychrotolerans]